MLLLIALPPKQFLVYFEFSLVTLNESVTFSSMEWVVKVKRTEDMALKVKLLNALNIFVVICKASAYDNKIEKLLLISMNIFDF